MKLYYYHNNDGVNWEKILVDQSGNVIFTPEFEISNNVLYLTYKRSDEPTSGDVFITKLDLLTVVFSPKIKPIISNRLDQNRPNPFSNRTRIGYFLNRPGYTKLFIKNLNGRPVKILFEG